MERSRNLMLIPTLMTVPALILLLTLGTWQLYRLAWKNTLIHKIEERVALPITDYTPTITLANDEYRKVKVTGTFLYDKEMFLYAGPRQYKGEQGYRLFTPLQVQGNNVTLLIDRGWIPMNQKSLSTRLPRKGWLRLKVR
jgi:surfeit locus 1 family protein